MLNRKLNNNPFEQIEAAMDVICVIEDVIEYICNLISDQHNELVIALTIHLQSGEGLEIHIPVFMAYTLSRQVLAVQILNACGWQKVVD